MEMIGDILMLTWLVMAAWDLSHRKHQTSLMCTWKTRSWLKDVGSRGREFRERDLVRLAGREECQKKGQ